MPAEDQLPDDLAPLARRQAVEVRDETWTEDVEMLVRRLEGKETVRASRRWIPVAIVVLALGVVGVAIWQAQADGDCPARDGTWIPVELAEDATGVEPLPDGRALPYRVGRTDYKYESNQFFIVLDVRLENVSEDVEGNDDHIGYGDTSFHALRVDRIAAGPLSASRPMETAIWLRRRPKSSGLGSSPWSTRPRRVSCSRPMGHR